MGLRYRLFLWVSGLFIVIAVTSYFLENQVTARELKRAQAALRQEILSLSETRRERLQSFIAESIAEHVVRIDAILSNILEYAPVALRFSPLSVNEEQGTWGESSDLLMEYKWIDFLQNTAEDRVIALISPEEESADETYQIPIDDSLFWVYFHADPQAYLGVKIPYFLLHSPDGGKEKLEQVPGEIPLVLFAFDVEKMQQVAVSDEAAKRNWPPIPVKWTEGYALNVEEFVQTFTRAQELLKARRLIPPSLSAEELQKRIAQAGQLETPLLSPVGFPSSAQGELMKKRLNEVALDNTRMNLIWMWLALFDSGVFGSDLFQFPAPVSAGLVNQGHAMGFGIRAEQTLFSTPVFQDQAYYEAHLPQTKGSGVARGLAVIPAGKRLFLGNTAQLIVEAESQERKGYLTLGIDAAILLERLVLALDQTALLVHGGTVFDAYQADGQKLSGMLNFPLAQMQDRMSGLVTWDGESYFYMHLTPFPDLDLHLFLLNPEKKEFALLRDLEAGAQTVVDAILLNIHITGLVALFVAIVMLHRISRRITGPIVELAQATESVAAGHLDRIQLKEDALSKRDEVHQLYDAFRKMIVGLQEKEKVKAVLNKVVSSDIAQEILQGNVHLGGEEKLVSVLFADIRGFTDMTQHQPARAVIEMLNACMTKLSAIVDEHKGVIDKYIGDAVMALFGAPVSRGNDALHAVTSALEMMERMDRWNQERKSRGEAPVAIGIGIHTGIMLAGNMGAENRLNYTVIGSNVNLAARLCSAAAPGEILISEQTREAIQEDVAVEPLEPLALKGFDAPIAVYRVLKRQLQNSSTSKNR